MAVTLREVAQRAGVSRSAVSRTFTPGASVSKKTREKVEKAADELGYQPNALASSLTTGRTKLVGLVVNNFRNPAYMEMLDLFTSQLQAAGLRPLLVNLSNETDPENSLRMLRQYSVDAAVVASSTLPPSFPSTFKRAGIPVVHSFGRPENGHEVPVVGIDNLACGRIAARTLLDRGYHRIAFMGGPERATSTQDRLSGFLSEVAGRQDVKVSYSFAEDYRFQAGRNEMLRLLDEGPAEAYFCGDDVLSIGAKSAIIDRGLRVPEDIGLIGLNDMEMAGWNNIDLTTIRQPIPEIVAASVAVVLELLEAPEITPQSRVFDCAVVERGTLRAPR